MTGGQISVSNSGSISGGNCGELLLTSYSRDVHQLLAELFTAAGAAGIASGSCGRSCFPLPSRAGRSCFPRPSRSAQPFRALDRTCSAQLLALPLRALTGSSRLFLHSPWLPAAFSQGSFPQTPDHPRPSTVRRPSTSTAPSNRAHAPSTTDAHRHASTVSRCRVWSGGPRQVAPCSRSAVARAAGPRPQPEPLARLPPTPGRARVGCCAGGREWGGQPPRYRSPPPGPDAAYMLGH